MSILVTKLSNGVLFPAFALGTWQLGERGESVADAANAALANGYHAIDTAWIYRNESQLGEPVSSFSSDIAYKKIVPSGKWFEVPVEQWYESFSLPHGKPVDNRRTWVTTKIWLDAFEPELIRKQVDEHLNNFKRSSADLVLLHWPGAFEGCSKYAACGDKIGEFNCDAKRIECWKELERLYKAGVCRAIGVSNYMEGHLAGLIQDINARKAAGDEFAQIPHVNQFEISAFCTPKPELVQLCADNQIQITSYSTLGGATSVSKSLNEPVVTEIADKYGVSPSSVLLRWALEQGFSVIPKSSSRERIALNAECLTFTMDPSDVQLLSKLNTNAHVCPNPYAIA